MESNEAIRVAAAIITRSDGKTLLVRKRGTSAFMQPGGKIETAEQPAAALCRELFEELGLSIDLTQPAYLGCYSAIAANEPGRIVEAEVFRVAVSAPVAPSAEIEEIAWVDPADTGGRILAPLTRERLLPLLTTAAAS